MSYYKPMIEIVNEKDLHYYTGYIFRFNEKQVERLHELRIKNNARTIPDLLTRWINQLLD